MSERAGLHFGVAIRTHTCSDLSADPVNQAVWGQDPDLGKLRSLHT